MALGTSLNIRRDIKGGHRSVRQIRSFACPRCLDAWMPPVNSLVDCLHESFSGQTYGNRKNKALKSAHDSTTCLMSEWASDYEADVEKATKLPFVKVQALYKSIGGSISYTKTRQAYHIWYWGMQVYTFLSLIFHVTIKHIKHMFDFSKYNHMENLKTERIRITKPHSAVFLASYLSQPHWRRQTGIGEGPPQVRGSP